MRFRRRVILAALLCFFLATTALLAEVVGSKNSNKYHNPSCEWAQKINPRNKVTFKDAKEAESKGYVACKVCKPNREK